MFDFLVIGAGIVGLSTAYTITRRSPGARVAVVEKEPAIATHQTGRNSGVIHSGLYYKPGSQKAILCRKGKKMLEEFCSEHHVPWEQCGKVVVATRESELEALQTLAERGTVNGVQHRSITSYELKELEPNTHGIAGLHVMETGIVDYVAVCQKLADLIERAGGTIVTQSPVLSIQSANGLHSVQTSSARIKARVIVNCGGLHSDQIMKLTGLKPPVRIVPFRGEYFVLAPSATHLCRNLIYPVPNPQFPFLGVHFTRMISGGVECGPNAVLAMAREGYSWREWNMKETLGTIFYPGFRKLAMRYWKTGLGEIVRSLSKKAFVSELQRLVPAIEEGHLKPAPAGVRAQAVYPDGRLLDDFLIERAENIIHVLNTPSPAATASLAIAEHIVDQIFSSAT